MSDLFASAVRVNGYPVISKQEFYQNQYLKKPRPVATLTDDMRGGYWVHNPDKSGWFVSPGGNPYFRYDAAGITQLNHKKTPIPAGDWLTECESAYFKQIYELEPTLDKLTEKNIAICFGAVGDWDNQNLDELFQSSLYAAIDENTALEMSKLQSIQEGVQKQASAAGQDCPTIQEIIAAIFKAKGRLRTWKDMKFSVLGRDFRLSQDDFTDIAAIRMA